MEKIKEKVNEETIMSDVYDVYSKAVKIKSDITNMSEDYVLTRYDFDVYNEKFPKFIREQRKLLRVIKTYLIVQKKKLAKIYNNEKTIENIHDSLVKEYKIIEELLLGELDECVIMARSPRGEVIKAFLGVGMTPDQKEMYEEDIREKNIKTKLVERK